MSHILLLEPYYGGSHRLFVDGFCRHTRHATTLYALPARFWKWRMHGAAVHFARRLRTENLRPDILFASDMLDLAAFKGLAGDLVADVPAVVYFHENQLTYPPPPGTKRDLHYGWINFTSCLAADRILFNSAYHRASFLDELPRLLKHFPDYNHLETVAEIERKCQVLPLGCDLARLDPRPQGFLKPLGSGSIILWNQRWEYDKNPAEFFAALYQMLDEGHDFNVILAGENFRNQPAEFEEARQRLGARVLHYGYAADPAEYARLLWQADIVVSTAIHEFFGLATVEAIYCDCYPILPHRLAYPELIPPESHDRYLYRDFDGLLERLRWTLTHSDELRQHSLRSWVARLDWANMIATYDRCLTSTNSLSLSACHTRTSTGPEHRRQHAQHPRQTPPA